MQSSSNPTQRHKIIVDLFTFIKIGVVVGMLIFLICNSRFAFILQSEVVECFTDKIMDLTTPINNFLINNEVWRNALTITSSLMIDISFIGIMVYWILFIRSWRLIVSLLLFYGMRGLIQCFFIFSFPEGYTFKYPGFPSLIVVYTKTSDFFYSGHIGLPLIASLEFNKNGLLAPCIVCLCITLIEGSFMLFVRAHYSIDIIAGLVFAHYFFMITDKYIHYVDTLWLNMVQGVCLIKGYKEEETE